MPEYVATEAFHLRDKIKDTGVGINKELQSHPHITLIQGEIPVELVPDLQIRITEIADKFSGLQLQMQERLYFSSYSRNVFWNVELTEELQRLHEATAEVMRTTPNWRPMEQFRSFIDKQLPLDPTQRKIIEQYGAVYAGSNFLPHITLVKLEAPADFEKVKEIQPPPASFQAGKLVGGHLDPAGAFTELDFRQTIG